MCHMASLRLLPRTERSIHYNGNEEKIAERIDANLLNVNIQEITDLPKQMFETKVNNLAKKTQGTLIIKEYPTTSAHVGHFKSLLNELSLKKSFNLILFSLITLTFVLPLGIGEAQYQFLYGYQVNCLRKLEGWL